MSAIEPREVEVRLRFVLTYAGESIRSHFFRISPPIDSLTGDYLLRIKKLLADVAEESIKSCFPNRPLVVRFKMVEKELQLVITVQ